VRPLFKAPREEGFWLQVAVFNLIGHRKAKRAYAWNYHERKKIEATVESEIPPLDVPQISITIMIAITLRQRK
jgi:hypothetical protein